MILTESCNLNLVFPMPLSTTIRSFFVFFKPPEHLQTCEVLRKDIKCLKIKVVPGWELFLCSFATKYIC